MWSAWFLVYICLLICTNCVVDVGKSHVRVVYNSEGGFCKKAGDFLYQFVQNPGCWQIFSLPPPLWFMVLPAMGGRWNTCGIQLICLTLSILASKIQGQCFLNYEGIMPLQLLSVIVCVFAYFKGHFWSVLKWKYRICIIRVSFCN